MKDFLSCKTHITSEKQYVTPLSIDNPLNGFPPIFTRKS